MLWKRYPILRVFLALSAGICCATCYPFPFKPALIFCICSLLLLLVSGFIPFLFNSYKLRSLYGLHTIAFFFLLGIVSCHFYSEKQLTNHYLHLSSLKGTYEMEILESPLEKEKSLKTTVEVKSIIQDKNLLPIKGKILLYLQKNEKAFKLKAGDIIAFKGNLQLLQKPLNPYQFDYSAYLKLQSVYAQAYVAEENWELIKSPSEFHLIRRSSEWRLYLLNIIEQWSLPENEKTVSKALLLGFRDEIDEDLLKAYASTGATHVLAVSGLHVGIVYLMSYYLLLFLGHSRKSQILRSLILVLLLWIYACITGLSPSVVRAATMFTFVAVGSGFKRNTSIYNTLLASAIFLILIKPTYLFDVGFQLSYLAVFGIVWIQPRLDELWQPKFWLWEKLKTILTVSVAAQFATFPLGLYYFHQFPGSFLISNLIVIPLITLIMYSGIIVLILSVAGWHIPLFLKVYEFFLSLMNNGIKLVESGRFLLFDQLHISQMELIFLYLITGFIFLWLFSGRIKRLQTALIILLGLSTYQVVENYHLQQKSVINILAIKGHSAIGFKQQNKYYLLSDKTFLKDDDALSFNINQNLWANNITSLKKIRRDSLLTDKMISISNCHLIMGKDIFWIYDRNTIYDGPAENWLVENYKLYPPEKSVKLPKRIILMNNISSHQWEKWKSWAKLNKVEIVNTLTEGAYDLIIS